MKKPLFAFVLSSLGGCVTGNPAPLSQTGADAGFDVENGGTLALAECGYSVTTQIGAEAPVIIPAGSATTGPDPTPKQVHLALAGDPKSSMVVLWRTNDDVSPATTVQYGKQSVGEASEDGISFRFTTGFGSNGPEVRVHETHLCGLTADTVYHYRVGGRGSDGTESWSPEYTFRTAPDLAADPSAQVTAVVLGDTRGGTTDWGTTLATAESTASPDVILFTGDAVTLGQLQSEWEVFFDAASPVLNHVPMVVAHGNHDADSVAFFSLNANPGNEQYFGLDYGAFHLTVLNDSPIDAADINTVERQFLMSDLTAHAAAPWKLVMHHKPTYSSAANHGSDLTLRDQWGSVFDAQGVDLVVNGHDHDYERSSPMKAGAVVAAGQGTTYVVSGSAGAELYDNGHDFFTVTSEKTENFVVLTIRTGSLAAKAYRADGTLIESFGLTK